MQRRLICPCIVCILLSAAPGYAQIDYFSAAQSPDHERYLQQVDNFHTNKVPDSIRVGRLDVAMADLHYALERFPNHPKALQLVGMVAQMRKQTAVAVSYFENALRLFPQHALTHAQYGLFLTTTGQTDEGIEMLKQSIEIDPTLAASYAGLAHAYAKKGDMEQAREAARKARELGFRGQLPAGF